MLHITKEKIQQGSYILVCIIVYAWGRAQRGKINIRVQRIYGAVRLHVLQDESLCVYENQLQISDESGLANVRSVGVSARALNLPYNMRLIFLSG